MAPVKVGALAALALAGCTFGTKTPRQLQQEALAGHMPQTIAAPVKPADAPPAGPMRVVKVLALIDDDFRTQALHPEAVVHQQFDEASRYTAGALRTRFEVMAIRPWSHRAGTAPLSRALEQLAEAEPGTDA